MAEGELGDGRAELARDAALRAPFGRGVERSTMPDLDDELDIDLERLSDLPTDKLPATDGEDGEETVPGGDEPPPLPDGPSLSDDALAELDAAVEEALSAHEQEPPSRDAPASFEPGDLERLDDAPRDDRFVTNTGVAPSVRVTFHEVGTSETTMPARPSSHAPFDLDLDLGDGDDDGLELERTRERGDARSGWGRERATREEEPCGWSAGAEVAYDGNAEGEAGNAGDEEDEQTRDRTAFGERIGRAPTQDPELSVIVDQALLGGDDDDLTGEMLALPDSERTREVGVAEPAEPPSARGRAITGVRSPTESEGVSVELLGAQIDQEIERAAEPDEAPDDRTRRRVTALIARAEQEHRLGHHPLAVTALDLALEEAPESAIAQKIIHRHRDLMARIYAAYLGNDQALPMVALPAHEISVQQLDNRAAFLLSRIDGTLTFEEILDVAGMGRLEAYRHLCRLLLRGILEVR